MWNIVLEHGIELAFTLLGLGLTLYLPQLIDAKIKDIKLNKYVKQLNELVSDSVKMVNQTYVDYLRGSDWNTATKAIAFNTAKDAVLAELPKHAMKFLSSAFADIDAVINNKIESIVSTNK